MDHSHLNTIPDDDGVKIGMISPDGRQGMIDHAEQFAEAAIPFIFDPGQGLPMFDGVHLKRFVELASWVAVNDYEGKMLSERTGWSLEEIARHVEALIVTRGGEGSIIFAGRDRIEIPAVEPSEILDPTGCGDAYRAGLIYGITKEMSWEDTGRLASILGAEKIAHRGTQNHRFSPESLARRFQTAFGHAITL
jgi:adenosine kinase